MAIAQMEQQNQGNFVQRAMAWPAEVKDYVEDLRAEMRRVTWPNWKQVRATTAVVLFAVFVFAAYFAVVDQLVNMAVTKLFTALTH